MGISESTDFKRTRRPPRDKSRARYPPKWRSIASKTSCHSCVVIRPSTRGSPKYRIGKEPSGVSRMWAHRSLSSTDIPNPMKVDLARLRLRPENFENISRRAETFSAAATEPSIKKIMSSAYCNKGTSPGHPAVWKPASSPLMHSLSMHTASVSAARMKRRGASGQPCGIPLWGCIHPPCGRPFTSTTKVFVHTHCFVHLTHVSGKPRRCNTRQMNR